MENKTMFCSEKTFAIRATQINGIELDMFL